jgi:hypothetical protein
MSARWPVASALLAVVITGCGGEERLVACDIATPSCQEDVYYALLRLRGDGFDPVAERPPIRTITKEEYCRAQNASKPVPDEPEREPDEPEPEPQDPPLVPWDFALHVLGLVKPTKTTGQARGDNLCDFVAAFYATKTRAVTVIDFGPRPGETAEQRAGRELTETALLLHELVHALQDPELSGEQFDGTYDSNLTARTLTEGEATFYQRIAQREMIDGDPEGHDWQTDYADWVGKIRSDITMHPSPFFGVQWFIYPLGGQYLTEAWLGGGNAAVRRAYAHPRRFTQQFIAGFGHRAEVLDPPLSCPVAAPSSSYALVKGDRFGALVFYGFMRRAGIPDQDAWPLAAAWNDDRILVFFDSRAEIAVMTWVIRLEHDADAERVLGLLKVVDPRLRSEARGRDLILSASSDEAATHGWDGGLDCALP